MSGVRDILRSLLFYLVFYTGSIVYAAVGAAVMGISPARLGRTVRAWSSFHRICARHLLGIRVVVEGTLPSSGVLMAMKHESFFEAIDAPYLVPFAAVVAKAELLRIPLWGKAAKAYGLVGVERDQGATALRVMLGEARQRIAANRVMIIFPEGTRVPHGQIAPLAAGFAGLYKLLKVPVVPVAVDSGALYHRRWKRAGTITVRVGELIAPGLPRDEIEARVTAAINVLNPVASR
jgi:1-acyl-sn-glycerol-3-phosphate acyltransferase